MTPRDKARRSGTLPARYSYLPRGACCNKLGGHEKNSPCSCATRKHYIGCDVDRSAFCNVQRFLANAPSKKAQFH